MERLHGHANWYTVNRISVPSVTLTVIEGNTIFLALSTAGLPAGGDSFKWARSGLSIVSLVLGSLITGRIYAAAGPTRRVTLVTSFLLQALCVIFAAILVHTDAVPETDPTDKLVLIAIPFLAAQSGAQVVTAKSLGFSEIPTSVLTSIYNDIGSDTQLFAWKNPKRDRRLCAVVMMLLGGISGAWLSCTEGSLSNVLWTGALLKLLIGLGWLFFQAEAEI